VEIMASHPLSLDRPARTDDRRAAWLATSAGYATGAGVVGAHAEAQQLEGCHPLPRQAREEREAEQLAPSATRALGAGRRAHDEEPDPWRTCFERDRDRILHSQAFRRLAGKTQVFIFPRDHQRTRLTHALEVAQLARAIARNLGLNEALTEAIALGHDCGHGPGGHPSEAALDPYLPEGYDHAVQGASVVLAPLNLCRETLDGIENHSWSRPRPATPEGEVVSLADRIAYLAHDLEDANAAGIVTLDELPSDVVEILGVTRGQQLGVLIEDVTTATLATKTIGLSPAVAEALASLRRFNFERIYDRPASRRQGAFVVALLRSLVDYVLAHPSVVPEVEQAADRVRAAVAWVAGMTDRYALAMAQQWLGWRTPPPEPMQLLWR